MLTAKKFLRRDEVEQMTGLPTSSLYEEMSKGRFPKPVRISKRAVAWLENEVADWQQDKVVERDR